MSADLQIQIAAFFKANLNASKKCAFQNLATASASCQFRTRPLEANGSVKTTEEEKHEEPN